MGHARFETTCYSSHVQAHSSIVVEAFLQENRRTALDIDDFVLPTIGLRNYLQFLPKR